MVLGVHHFAVYGKPIGVDVDDAHEYGQLDTAAVQVLVFVYFLACHYAAVGAGDHGTQRVAAKTALGRPKEVGNQDTQRAQYGGEYDGKGERAYAQPQGYAYGGAEHKQCYQYMDAFVMYFYSHEVRLSINCVLYVCFGVIATDVVQPLSTGAMRYSRHAAYIQVANLHFFLEMGLERLAKNALFGLKYASRTDENLYLWLFGCRCRKHAFRTGVCLSRFTSCSEGCMRFFM